MTFEDLRREGITVRVGHLTLPLALNGGVADSVIDALCRLDHRRAGRDHGPGRVRQIAGNRGRRADVPDQLLACQSEPTPPATGSQRKVASYVLDLAEAGDDCRTKLGAVRSILT